MVTCTTGEFNGLRCIWLSNGLLRLAVTIERGPRVLFWGWQEGPNIFAEVPQFVQQTPYGTYEFLGGHRLWYAPESLYCTYCIDTWPVEVHQTADGAHFITPSDAAGIARELHITLAPDRAQVTLSHVLRNTGLWSAELAPWPLSMCRLGGVVLLPQPTETLDRHGYLPNRRYSFWTYSDPTDPRLHLGNQIALVFARQSEEQPRNKLGYRNHHGWMAYWLEGTLFSKRFEPNLAARHPDFDCNAECYFSNSFVELESLGPLAPLEPGAEVAHNEVWELHRDVEEIVDEAAAVRVASALGLFDSSLSPMPVK